MPKPLSKKRRVPDLTMEVVQGLELERRGLLAEAEEIYLRVLDLDPTNSYASHRMAVMSLNRGDLDAALRMIEASMRANPSAAMALADYAQILDKLGRHEESLAAANRSLVLKPRTFEALHHRSVALRALDRHIEALVSLERVIAVNPGHAPSHTIRGHTLLELGRRREAMEAFLRSQALDPSYPDAHLNEGLLLLLQGDFAAGWEKYEWRWQISQMKGGMPPYPQPVWDGREPLAGKSLYVFAEQGLGDVLMFARYLPILARQAREVVFGVYPSLKSLLQSLANVVVLGPGDTHTNFDLQCALMSLPHLLGTRLDTIPAEVPYLSVPEERRRKWQTRVPHATLTVGLVWAGGRDYTADRKRSIGLTRLEPVLSVPGVRFVSLHRDLRETDAAVLARHPEIVHFGEALEDFADTAAVIDTLDLVISVDTSVVHLTGALGKPVWVMLPFAPDFRWLLDRRDSPWYPSATLFRQPTLGDWATVVGDVSRHLAAVAGNR
jgi:tetratricopeptide (TPR) repeat protein